MIIRLKLNTRLILLFLLYIEIYLQKAIRRGWKYMKVRVVYALDERKFEKQINDFLEENKDKIEIIEIKWKCFLYHYAMIMYKEK